MPWSVQFTIPERNRATVSEFRRVMNEGHLGPNGLLRKPIMGKTIVFAVTRRHAETLARLFDEAFADQKPTPETRYADFVVSELPEDDSGDAEAKIKRFKDEAFSKILVSVNMLDTGFDCPEVTHLVMARFTKSSILYQQMRGRGTRKVDHIHKTRFTIWDFVGVTAYHTDDEVVHEGGVVLTPLKRVKTQSRASFWCWMCPIGSIPPPGHGRRWTRTATLCPSMGQRPARKNWAFGLRDGSRNTSRASRPCRNAFLNRLASKSASMAAPSAASAKSGSFNRHSPCAAGCRRRWRRSAGKTSLTQLSKS
jgi:hypothetical protein